MDMNILINRIDNLEMPKKSYKLINDSIEKENQIFAYLTYLGKELQIKDVKIEMLFKLMGVKDIIGSIKYDSLLKNPFFIAIMPSEDIDFSFKRKKEMDRHYGIKSMIFNNMVISFSLAVRFIKDSCINSTNFYLFNTMNLYHSDNNRNSGTTTSRGEIESVKLNDDEVEYAIKLMYEIYGILLESNIKISDIESSHYKNITNWEVDNSMNNITKSFPRALKHLQRARRTGDISDKISEYCSVLECPFSIKKDSAKNIGNITAAYIGNKNYEVLEIKEDIKQAYGIRSDDDHGQRAKYLKSNSTEDLDKIARKTDDYVRRVFNKVIKDKGLNYEDTIEDKARVRKFFMDKAKGNFPSEY